MEISSVIYTYIEGAYEHNPKYKENVSTHLNLFYELFGKLQIYIVIVFKCTWWIWKQLCVCVQQVNTHTYTHKIMLMCIRFSWAKENIELWRKIAGTVHFCFDQLCVYFPGLNRTGCEQNIKLYTMCCVCAHACECVWDEKWEKVMISLS